MINLSRIVLFFITFYIHVREGYYSNLTSSQYQESETEHEQLLLLLITQLDKAHKSQSNDEIKLFLKICLAL